MERDTPPSQEGNVDLEPTVSDTTLGRSALVLVELGALRKVQEDELYPTVPDRIELIPDLGVQDSEDVAGSDSRAHVHIFLTSPHTWAPSLERQIAGRLAGRQSSVFLDPLKITINLNVVANTPEMHAQLKSFARGVARWLDLSHDDLGIFTRIRPRGVVGSRRGLGLLPK